MSNGLAIFDNVVMRARKTSPPQRTGTWDFISSTPSAGKKVTVDTALTYTALYAAVGIISGGVAVLPIKLHKETSDGSSEVVGSNPLHSLLARSPNPEQTPIIFKENMTGDLCLWGNAYAEIARAGRGSGQALWRLDPSRTRPVRQSDGTLVYEYQNQQGGTTTLAAADVIHLRLFGDDVIGWSPVRLAREAIASGLAMEEYKGAFFGNNATPGGVLEHPGTIKPEGRKQLRKEWEEMHRGSSKANRVGILQEGMKFNVVGMPHTDAQFLELTRATIQDIARIYRVPPHMLAEMSDATFSNIGNQQLWFLMHTLMIYLKRWEEELNRKLLPEGSDLSYRFTTQSLMRGDHETRAKFYKAMREVGAFSANDILRLEDRNSIGPEGDLRFVQVNMAPLERFLDPDFQSGQPSPGSDNKSNTTDDDDDNDENDEKDDDSARALFLPVIRDATGRLVHKEISSLRRILKRGGDVDAAVCRFYRDFEKDVSTTLKPCLMAYAKATGRTIVVSRETSRFIESGRSLVLDATREGRSVDQMLDGWAGRSCGEMQIQGRHDSWAGILLGASDTNEDA